MYKVVPHHCAQSHQVQSNEDNTPAHEDLPILTHQKWVLHEATRDLSEQDVGSNSSQEEDNSPDKDLLNLNNNKLVVAFNNEMISGLSPCSAGLGQCNICINMQPNDLKNIIKDAIRTLHCDCLFKHGSSHTSPSTEPISSALLLALWLMGTAPRMTRWNDKHKLWTFSAMTSLSLSHKKGASIRQNPFIIQSSSRPYAKPYLSKSKVQALHKGIKLCSHHVQMGSSAGEPELTPVMVTIAAVAESPCKPQQEGIRPRI
ncbi:hypothetical protein EI94DRAFT_1704771 [Lactarius quietus]|nr:hypothetical protein EI94DRAFT_1704771 [Lactarius quietus]